MPYTGVMQATHVHPSVAAGIDQHGHVAGFAEEHMGIPFTLG